MKINGIDNEKCIKCLECVKECPESLFVKPPTPIGESRKVNFEDPNNICILCGHCIAICPVDAIEYESEERAQEFEGIEDPLKLINFKQQIKILQARRSVRRFKEADVSKENIDLILKATKYAPSARNERSWRFIILRDKEHMEEIRKAVIKMLTLLRTVVKYKWILKYFAPKSVRDMIEDPTTGPKLDEFISSYEEGEDPVFYNAPVVMILYSPSNGNLSGADAGIALTNTMLAAQSLGLGTCWIGYAQEALNRYGETKQDLEIPKGMNVNGVLIIGYPDVKFKKIPPRESLDVKWI
ncbi:MAG: 4Fe-4S dicluster domain-containing protein [Promethearchaeota archaeon]|nr:MAG: 4Fe-4S dicluster domain-containing protein [Candidatus Lokiarchaeota archaeon]